MALRGHIGANHEHYKDSLRKSKAIPILPLDTQLVFATFSRSNVAYGELRSISPLVLPGPRQLQRIKHRNKVRDSKDVKVYQLQASSKGLDERVAPTVTATILPLTILLAAVFVEYGYFMTDGMKLKDGVL